MKKHVPTIQGRSFLFNALFVLFNIAGVVLAVLGAQPFFQSSFFWLNFLGYTLIGISTAGLVIFQGKLMMANVLRALVGTVFIVSGIIKANDPVGFAYKLEEYFQDGALAYRIKEFFGDPSFSLEFLANHSLFLAALICIVEIVLGVFTLIGLSMKKVAWFIMALMLFFTFLTWHTASCDPSATFTDRNTYESTHPAFHSILASSKNPKSQVKVVEQSPTSVTVDEVKHVQCVTDCGCFGDAMKGAVGRSLTPWESFWKDLVLVYFALWMLFANRIVEPNARKANGLYLIATLLISATLSWVFDWYLLSVFSVLLVISALWILRSGGNALGNSMGVLVLTSLLSFSFISYVLLFDPVKDYRPFAEGSNIRWKMNDGKEGVYSSVFVLKNKRTGSEESYTEKEYMSQSAYWDEKKYQFIKRDQIELIPGRLPSISDQFNPSIRIQDISNDERSLSGFEEQLLMQTKSEAVRLKDRSTQKQVDVAVSKYSKKAYPDSLYEMVSRVNILDADKNEINLTEWLLDQPLVFVFSSLNIDEADWSEIDRIKDVVDYARETGIPVVLLTRGSRTQINRWKQKYKLSIATFSNDDKGLMMISRSNPNLMLFKNGVVRAKYTRLNLPNAETLKKKLKKQ